MNQSQVLLLSPLSLQNNRLNGVPLNLDNIIYAFEGKGAFDTLDYSQLFIKAAQEMNKNLHFSPDYQKIQKEKQSILTKLQNIKKNYSHKKYDDDYGIQMLRRYLDNVEQNDDIIMQCAAKQLHAKEIMAKLNKQPHIKQDFIAQYNKQIQEHLDKYPEHIVIIPGSDPNIEFAGLDITSAKYWAIKYITQVQRKEPIIAICGGVQAMLHNEDDTVFGTMGRVDIGATKGGKTRSEEIEMYNKSICEHDHCNSNGMYHNPSDSNVKNTAQERCEHNQVVLVKKQDISLDNNGRLQEGTTLLPAFGEKYKKHGHIFTNDSIICDIENSQHFIVHYSLHTDSNGKINTIGIQHHIDVENEKGPMAITMIRNLVKTYNKDSLTQGDCKQYGIPDDFIGHKMKFEHFTNALQNINLYLNTPNTRDITTSISDDGSIFVSPNCTTFVEPNFLNDTFKYERPIQKNRNTQTTVEHRRASI